MPALKCTEHRTGHKKPFVCDKKLGHFCIKSGPLTDRKQQVNDLKPINTFLLTVCTFKAIVPAFR